MQALGIGRKQTDKIQKYGLLVSPLLHPFELEAHMIRNGGQWLDAHGRTVGNGLLFHYKELQTILWPWKTWHKWNERQLALWIEHRTLAVMGPSSSGKTCNAASDHLAEWFVFPDETTVIFCSTTKERLEDRVWGEVKRLFTDAKKRFDFLPGYLIEGRLRIVLSRKLSDVEGRDFRCGMCFPRGTLIDTPLGQVPVETIKTGDLVLSAVGTGRVTRTFESVSPKLVRITLSDGRIIDCTEDHPILTQRGWIKAVALETLDMVFSVHDTLRIVREEIDQKTREQELQILLPQMPTKQAMPGLRQADRKRLSEQEVLLCWLSGFSAFQKMFPVREYVPSCEQASELEGSSRRAIHRTVLLQNLRRSMGWYPQRMRPYFDEAVRSLWHTDEERAFLANLLLSEMSDEARSGPLRAVRQGVYFNTRVPTKAPQSILQPRVPEQGHWSRQRSPSRSTYEGGDGCLEDVPGVGCSFSSSHRTQTEKRERALVSTGHSVSEFETGGRDRWRNPQRPIEEGQGRKANGHFARAWVVGVTLLEPRSDPRHIESEGGYRVHNLEVEGHPSYSVNGVIVHNCGVPCKKGETFIGLGDFVGIKNKRVRLVGDELALLPGVWVDALANLDKNEDFKATGLGNPKETTDALGRLAEPALELGGWESGIDQAPGTKHWKTKRPQGVCLQLSGDDSPNYDGTLGIPLITKEAMDRDEAFYGRDSLWFTMFNLGRMPRGQGSRRILTQQMCEKFGAFNQPVWLDTNRTQIAFLDAAYRGVGGDRCIFGTLEFGQEAEGPSELETVISAIIFQLKDHLKRRQILAITSIMNVPISVMVTELPEDQIVKFVMERCKANGIGPENFFFDAGMRTSLVTAFSRVWSPAVNSIDFGGRPSERPVSSEITVLCRDYYSKFVTELWFSFRLAVESGQVRGMTPDMAMEFCQREWTIVGNNKIEAESKENMKRKFGRSPDIADAIVTGLHGAIERGFKITRKTPDQGPDNPRRTQLWIKDLKARSKKLWASGALETNA